MTDDASLLLTSKYPLSLINLAARVRGSVTAADKDFIRDIEKITWSEKHLNLARLEDRRFAAHALSLGVPVFHGFGNFYALTFHPNIEVIRSVNVAKGRPLEQVASIMTTKEHLGELFDWQKLPQGFTREKILKMMDAFFEIGPFGFRGPAAKTVDSHLTKEIAGKRTIQVIAPGYHCPSNELLKEALHEAKIIYFAATSPNISRNITGAEEPAHYKLSGIKKDFKQKEPGFVMVSHQSEKMAAKMYPLHELMSTSIISFDRDYPLQEGLPVVTIERHGSLEMIKIIEILNSLNIGYVIGPNASKRLLKRKYSSQ